MRVGVGTNTATARTMMRRGKSGAKNAISISFIRSEPNWNQKTRGQSVAVYRVILLEHRTGHKRVKKKKKWIQGGGSTRAH